MVEGDIPHFCFYPFYNLLKPLNESTSLSSWNANGINLSFVCLSMLQRLSWRVLGKSKNDLNHVGQTLFF
jgi:hypothetical protein